MFHPSSTIMRPRVWSLTAKGRAFKVIVSLPDDELDKFMTPPSIRRGDTIFGFEELSPNDQSAIVTALALFFENIGPHLPYLRPFDDETMETYPAGNVVYYEGMAPRLKLIYLMMKVTQALEGMELILVSAPPSHHVICPRHQTHLYTKRGIRKLRKIMDEVVDLFQLSLKDQYDELLSVLELRSSLDEDHRMSAATLNTIWFSAVKDRRLPPECRLRFKSEFAAAANLFNRILSHDEIKDIAMNRFPCIAHTRDLFQRRRFVRRSIE